MKKLVGLCCLFALTMSNAVADEDCLYLETSQGCFKTYWSSNWQDCGSPQSSTNDAGELYYYCDPDWFMKKGDDYSTDFDIYHYPLTTDESGDDAAGAE